MNYVKYQEKYRFIASKAASNSVSVFS